MSLNMLRGTGEAWWCPSVANLQKTGASVTEDELEAGIKLGAGFNAINGLARQRNPINTPVMRHRTELQIPGPEQFQSVSVTVVEEDGTSTSPEAIERDTILTTMVEDSDGVLVLSRYSQEPAVGDPMWMIAAGVDDQEPNWDLGAAAMVTNINLTPSTPLYKGTLAAGS